MRNLKHNKRRNLGLVHEFLTREVTSAVLESNPLRAANSLSIISGHLSEGHLLHEELSLHRQVMESRGASEKLARRIVDELKAAGMRFSANITLRERAKSALIHEMNRTLGRDVFDRYRIPEYTAHASVSILLGRGINTRMDEGLEFARVEEHLTAFLTSTAAPASKHDPDATLYAYNVAIKIFESEIGSELDGDQQNLLGEYVRVTLGGNPAPFEKTFEKQRKSLIENLKLNRLDNSVKTDKEMAARLDEAIAELGNLRPSTDEESVERLMLFHNLRREFES